MIVISMIIIMVMIFQMIIIKIRIMIILKINTDFPKASKEWGKQLGAGRLTK